MTTYYERRVLFVVQSTERSAAPKNERKKEGCYRKGGWGGGGTYFEKVFFKWRLFAWNRLSYAWCTIIQLFYKWKLLIIHYTAGKFTVRIVIFGRSEEPKKGEPNGGKKENENYSELRYEWLAVAFLWIFDFWNFRPSGNREKRYDERIWKKLWKVSSKKNEQ